MRKFVSSDARRADVPLLLALIGPSGSGKTFSAHRLAKGIQRVQPGSIHGIDTENKRMLELADRFKFKHVPFEPPFGSLDYLAALQHCVSEGARTVIIDSMSHEHEGAGGLLDAADQYVEEKIRRKVEFKDLANADSYEADKARAKLKISSFIKPKADRSKLINGILQLPCNVIMCFRAKERIEPVAGKEPIKLGWQPIGGEEFWYEMTARCLLLPGCIGTPEWDMGKLEKGEKMAARRPEQFSRILQGQLSEDIGEAMARWALGPAGELPDATETLTRLEGAVSVESVKAIAEEVRDRAWSQKQRAEIAAAIKTQTEKLKKT